MAPTDPWKRYLDVGMELTNLTRERAEKIVKEFVKAGELRREEAQTRVEDLLERSRKASAGLAETVRTEVTRQLADLGLITIEETRKAASSAKKAASKTAKKSTGAAKKATAATAKKATATAKKATATAKKATGQS